MNYDTSSTPIELAKFLKDLQDEALKNVIYGARNGSNNFEVNSFIVKEGFNLVVRIVFTLNKKKHDIAFELPTSWSPRDQSTRNKEDFINLVRDRVAQEISKMMVMELSNFDEFRALYEYLPWKTS